MKIVDFEIKNRNNKRDIYGKNTSPLLNNNEISIIIILGKKKLFLFKCL